MLFNEPKLLKSTARRATTQWSTSFSALQRAEIAEIVGGSEWSSGDVLGFSALQRAEIAEIQRTLEGVRITSNSFSALQRAEIAEIGMARVLEDRINGFSALQRAEIAEIHRDRTARAGNSRFQCSSTSRNC